MIVKRNIESSKICEILSEILDRIHKSGPVSQEHFETLSYIKKFYPEEFSKYEKRLLYSIGLFYKVGEPEGIFELAYDTLANAIKYNTHHSYTPIQARQYKDISENKYYSFSAPTSTGKSYLFQDLIKEETRDVIIVLPSRALIAEYLYKIQNFIGKDVLVLQFVENVNILHTKRKVFILTPERSDDLFTFKEYLDVGMILFDEAQIAEEEIRGLKFDALVRKTIQAFPDAKKVFAHPFVSNPIAQLQRNQITDECKAGLFEQNVVGKIYVTRRKNVTFETFSPFDLNCPGFPVNDVIEEVLNNSGTVLFYVSKQKLYSGDFKKEYAKYIQQCDLVENDDAIRIIDALHKYIGDSGRGDKMSHLISLMKRGIVIHHGSMPLRARLLIEEFVNLKCAKLCFATSTLIQGINMPFDVVCVDNFRFDGSESKKILDLKNLIGRAGRTTDVQNRFDYGYVVVPFEHKSLFARRLCKNALLSNESLLDDDIENVNEDDRDIVEAIKEDTFDYDLRITSSQKSRIETSGVFESVRFVLDTLIKNANKIITGDEYYRLASTKRASLKRHFSSLYIAHLRRKNLKPAEQSVLSASIPIILWKVQGKSFKEIVSLRHSYITKKSERIKLKALLRDHRITEAEYDTQIDNLAVNKSVIAVALPNATARKKFLFESYSTFDYDRLVYDTYDYLDKVIGQSLTEPICAVLKMYANVTQDERALLLLNYIKYGTNDAKVIWLMRYGFTLDDMEWLVPCVSSVDENEIVFNDNVNNLEDNQKNLIQRYVYTS